ncbi:MAG TPA: LysM peptidoglycan-binding domain-containing protein [Streptosporangiaceae bacterium]
MSSARSSRRSVKIRRRGRHAAPSQVEKIAGKATVAAPVVAIAGGVIIGVPATAGAATTGTAAVAAPAVAGAASHSQTAKATLDAVTTADRKYDVQPGDTLGGIARRFYGSTSDWRYLYQQNTAVISNPNVIYAGEVLNVPSGAPTAAVAQAASASNAGQASATPTVDSVQAATGGSASVSGSSGSLSGTLSCSGLEQLWEQAGGSPSEAFMAAEIAMAESGGNQNAVSPTDDLGYWQINVAAHGSMATFNPIGNAKAAISISSDGINWNPWTTYQTGAYKGKC